MLTVKIYSRDSEDAGTYRTSVFEVQRCDLEEFETDEARKNAAIRHGLNKPLFGLLRVTSEIGDLIDIEDHFLHEGYKMFVENDSGKTTLVARY